MSELKGKKLFPFVAPPSGGKGTQTAALLKAYPEKLGKFDMGATFRAAVKDPNNPLGQKIREAMDAGRLVDISIVMQLFEKGLKEAAKAQPKAMGFILDGFPRNAEQLENLLTLCTKEGASLARAFYLNVPDQVVVDRAAGRVFHKETNEVFNIRIPEMYPPGFDPETFVLEESDYYQREDDKEETVRKRLESFAEETQPMIDMFRKENLLVDIDGNRKPEMITEDLLLKMESYLTDQQPSMTKTLGMMLVLAVPLAVMLLSRLIKG